MDKVLLVFFVILIIVSIYYNSNNNKYVAKNKLQEKYEKIKRDNKNKKEIKRLFKISVILMVLCLAYLGAAGLLGVITVGFMDYAMGNVDTEILSPFLKLYFNFINYIPPIFLLCMNLLAVRFLYIQLLNNIDLKNTKKLKNNFL